MAEFTRVAQVSEIAPGSGRAVTVGGQEILVCNSEGRFFAVLNRCSHLDESLECGRIRGGWILCPAHGARFDLETGEPMNHVTDAPLQVFPTRVVDDWIEVEA